MSQEIRRVGVVGAGAMGRGIAQVCAAAGCKVQLFDMAQDAVARARDAVRDDLAQGVAKGRLAQEDADATLSRIQPASELRQFGDCDLVVEAIVEQVEAKQQLFQALEAVVSPHCILATNTSSFSVTAIAASTQKPERVLGLHYFNPPPLMALVEVIQGDRTTSESIEQATDLMRQMGKTPARAKDTPGFIVNRVARPFYNEGLRILGDGDTSVETIDRVMREAGNFRMGPFELMDLIGNDVNFAATESLYRSFFEDPRFRPSPIQQRMVAGGNLGRKTGRGFYVYGGK